MGGFNLPPGCSVSDIPGNRPEDAAWECFSDSLFAEYPQIDRLDFVLAVIKDKEMTDQKHHAGVLRHFASECEDECDALDLMAEMYYPDDGDLTWADLKIAIDDHMSSRKDKLEYSL